MAEDIRETAPFNMALKTLEKVHNILVAIEKSSVYYSNDGEVTILFKPGQAQHIKYRLVRQLFIQSIPLFDRKRDDTQDWITEMGTRIKEVQLIYGNRFYDNKLVGKFEGFNQDIDDELDDIVIEISQQLQIEGYFMPPKDDARFSWKQN